MTIGGPASTAQVGVAYNSTLTASAGNAPYTFSITSGSLPPGLILSNASTGAITGTPTTAGFYTFTATVVDTPVPTDSSLEPNRAAARRRGLAQSGTPTASSSVSFSIFVAPAALALSGPSSTAQVGVGYTSALGATGGYPPYRFALVSGGLPPGLSLNTGTGAITGTPTTAGAYTFTASVNDTPPMDTDPNPASIGPDAARRRKLAQSGTHTASTSNAFTITVTPAAPSPTPVPPSIWMAITGLAGAGAFRLRQKRNRG